MSTTTQETPAVVEEKVGIGAYLSLIFAIIFFSGLCASSHWWGVFDFTTVNGGFGKLVSGVTQNGDALQVATTSFRGKGGSGAIDGFLPGSATLALIASLQSTDGGAALTRQLKDAGDLNDTEVNIFASFQMTADACITNFFSSGAVLFTLTNADGQLAVPVSLGLCLGVMLIGKVFAANLMRLLLIRSSKKAA